MTAPAWWKPGVAVVAFDGSCGTLQKTGAGEWIVDRYGNGDTKGYIVNPSPDSWQQRHPPRLTASQIDRIAYEAALGVYDACGSGGLKHWTSLSDSERVGVVNPLPVVHTRPELRALAERVAAAVRTALL